MPSQIDLDMIVADNPDIDLEEFKKGEEALKSLRQTGAVRPSAYGLDTPESKKQIRHNDDVSVSGGTTAFRRLR
ncbi:MAG: hypothetical protein WBE72_12725 [Terracidiphilus sp.]